MESFEDLAKAIVEKFEANMPVPTCVKDWENDAEEIRLYLAAKNYIEFG